jgi:serine/threonine protein kinase
MYLEVQRRAKGGLSGCVRLFSAHPQHHYLVLEDHGTDLRALLNPKLRYPQHVLEAVVSAVQALHSLGIMHGDIKPQNILCKWVDHDYVVKLCDLDSACKVGETCGAASLGTKHYHAPEVRVAARSGLTIAASLELDMFPLGLVLWQLLARSPHPVLDCAEEEELYTSQEKLDEHLNLASFYKPALQKVTCINPKQRMTIVDLYRAAKTLNSASTAQQGWLQEKEANRQLKDAFGSQLSAMDEKLDKMSAKLDTVLQELRTRFDALGSTAMEVAESLRKEIILGGQQAHVLPDVIQATQDALQRLSDAVDKTDQTQRNPGTSITELQDCMSSMQASIATAISRALAEQKKEDAGEFYAVAAQLQSQVSSLSTELQACLREQRQSSAHTAQQLDVLSHTSTCLQLGLKDVLSSLVEVQSELAELKKNQILLGKQMEESLASHADLNAMVRALAVNTHGVPTLAIILPVVSSSWKSTFSPMRLVRDQYRLYFLCSHTHQIAPCGPKGKGKGYKITMTKQWVLDAAPVLRVGLVLVKVALLASGLPLPVPDLCSALAEKGMHAQYLNAALHVVSNPPDAALTSAEYTMQHTLDAIDEHDYSEYKDAGAEARLQEGSRKAYEAIKEILGRDGVNIPLTCGLRQVTHRGKIAWVLDNDSAEKDWRDAVDASVLRGASV